MTKHDIPSIIREQGLTVSSITITPRDIELHCATTEQLHKFIDNKLDLAKAALHDLVDYQIEKEG